MLTTVALGVLTAVLVLGIIACVAAIADRSARAEAWRRIATERRWNHENVPTPAHRPSACDHLDRPA